MNKNLLESMLRYGIGLDPWFFEKNAETPNFPPHNIEQVNANHFILTLAVAGYQPDEMQVSLESDMLTISGRKHLDERDETEQNKMLYRGIAFRDFSRQFKIGENVNVQDVTLKHGLLTVSLVREIPEALKPRQIPISN